MEPESSSDTSVTIPNLRIVITQKTCVFNNSALRISNPARLNSSSHQTLFGFVSSYRLLRTTAFKLSATKPSSLQFSHQTHYTISRRRATSIKKISVNCNACLILPHLRVFYITHPVFCSIRRHAHEQFYQH
jgi:hypothetical protein